MKYHVRQYLPAYFAGFPKQVIRDVDREKILEIGFLNSFKYDGFERFTIESYGGEELIIEAHFTNGKHWIAGFAIPTDHPEANDWPYLLGEEARHDEHAA